MFTLRGQRVQKAKVFYRLDTEVGVMAKISGEDTTQQKLTEERIKTVTQFIRSLLGKGNETGEVVLEATVVVAQANKKILKLIDSMSMYSPSNEHYGWSWNGVQKDELVAFIKKI